MKRNYKSEVEIWLIETYNYIGMNRPENHSKIKKFIINDLKETADPKEWTDGDIGIAFRRFLETK